MGDVCRGSEIRMHHLLRAELKIEHSSAYAMTGRTGGARRPKNETTTRSKQRLTR